MCSLQQPGEKGDKTQRNMGGRGWHQEKRVSLLCSRKVVLKFSSQHTHGRQVGIASLNKSDLWPKWYWGRMGVANTLRKKRWQVHSLAVWG